MNMINARVGLQRIQKFMEAEEMQGRGGSGPTPSTHASAHGHGKAGPAATANPFHAITMDSAVPHEDGEVSDKARLLGANTSSSKSPKLPSSTGASHGSPLNGSAQLNGNGAAGAGSDDGTVDEEMSVVVRGGSFVWDAAKTSGEPTLKDIDLEVWRGQLVMVVGEVSYPSYLFTHTVPQPCLILPVQCGIGEAGAY